MNDSSFFFTNGVSIRYRLVGGGPALCLVNGFRLSGSTWPDEFVERLAERFNVLTFDCRGTGLSDKPRVDYAVWTMAEDVAGLIRGVTIGSAHVLGFSMGGAVAQELAIRHPAIVNKLVLFATFPGLGFTVPAPWWILRKLLDVDGLTPESAARQAWSVTYTADFLSSSPDVAEAQMLREIEHPTPDYAAAGQRDGLAGFSSGLRLPNVRAETLVVTGAEDKLVPPVNSRIIASRLRRARLQVLDGLGHRAIWEAPAEMANSVSDFLMRRKPRGEEE